MSPRKICVATATRAEYGLLRCLLEDINSAPDLQLQLVATGSHLSPEFGYTVQEILDDGFTVCRKIEILLSSDTPVGIAKSMGLSLISFAEMFEELQPDIFLVLGDRYELLPMVSAAVVARVPVAHLNGGEVTEGALDELFRHSVTKLSQLHFTAIQAYADRVVRMGESPERVFNVGELGLDGLKRLPLLSRREFGERIGRELLRRNLVITIHPETTRPINDCLRELHILLEQLRLLDETLLIFTKANADSGGRAINEVIDRFVGEHPNSVAFTSLGQLGYLSALSHVDAVLGNSSSGIVEAPSFRTATINLGDRQKGRIRAESVIDVEFEAHAIGTALERIYEPEFQALLSKVVNPYGQGDTSKKIIEVLRNVDLEALGERRFYDGAR